jgi:hypothetical protein
MAQVYLVLSGEKTRVVRIQVKKGRIGGEEIGRHVKSGEKVLGVIGHVKGPLAPLEAEWLIRQRADINALALAHEIDRLLPEMIPLSGNLSIMKTGISVALFGRLVKEEEINGSNDALIKEIMGNPQAQTNILNCISGQDAGMLAKKLNALTNRKFRLPTKDELLLAINQLSEASWIWIDAEEGRDNMMHVNYGSRLSSPDVRGYNRSVVFVEEK